MSLKYVTMVPRGIGSHFTCALLKLKSADLTTTWQGITSARVSSLSSVLIAYSPERSSPELSGCRTTPRGGGLPGAYLALGFLTPSCVSFFLSSSAAACCADVRRRDESVGAMDGAAEAAPTDAWRAKSLPFDICA